MIHVTNNAADRYVECVAPGMTQEEALAEIGSHRRAIEAAVDFRCSIVKLDSRARLILRGGIVVTVLRPDLHRRSLRLVAAQ